MIDKSKITLHVHILTAEAQLKQDLVTWANDEGLLQYSLMWEDGRWMLSAPIPMAARGRFAWLYHKHKGLNAPQK